MRNPTFSVKGKSGGSIAVVHQSDGWIAVELLDVGFRYWLVLSWVTVPTFDAALPDSSWLAILAAITFLRPLLVCKSLLGACARGNCRGWSSYSSSSAVSESLYLDSDFSSMLEALSEEISEESSSEADQSKGRQLLLQSISWTYENIRNYYLENPFVNTLN